MFLCRSTYLGHQFSCTNHGKKNTNIPKYPLISKRDEIHFEKSIQIIEKIIKHIKILPFTICVPNVIRLRYLGHFPLPSRHIHTPLYCDIIELSKRVLKCPDCYASTNHKNIK